MKVSFVLVFAFLTAVTFTTTFSKAAEVLPPADGTKVWSHISKTNPYLGWGFWPGYYGIKPGKSPHGAYVKVYANGIALKAAREGKPLPNGSILVKENYGKDEKTLMAVTPMYKINGYNPEGGDWFWGKYGPDGTVQAAGKPKGCIECHSVQKDKGWVFLQPENE